MNTGDTGLMHQQLLIAINFQDLLDCLEEVNIILTTNSYYDQICRVLIFFLFWEIHKVTYILFVNM